MTMQNESPFGNPFFDFLENDELGRRANFLGRLGPLTTSNQQNFAANRFPSFFNNFLQTLGQQILSGETPTATFTGSLDKEFGEGGQSFSRRFNRASPFETGQLRQRLVSPARTLFNV